MRSTPGTTDGTGTWSAKLVAGSLYWAPRFTIYGQFAFRDGGQPYGMGLTDCSPIRLPVSSLASIYAHGSDTALTGSTEGTFA